jgi:uncharacterized membrane protein
VLLRRAFLVSSSAWVAAIPLATWAATRPAASAPVYGFALGVYAIGRVVCHQLPLRSFHLWGASLPVCARCTGIYVGAAVAAVLLRASPAAVRAKRFGGRFEPRWILLAALVPTGVTLVFEWTTGVMPANWIRALAGAPLGAAVAWAIGMVN